MLSLVSPLSVSRCCLQPEEYLGTWYWNCCVFTWPSHPREGEPKLTMTDRRSIAMVSFMVNLLFYLLIAQFMLSGKSYLTDKVSILTNTTRVSTTVRPVRT